MRFIALKVSSDTPGRYRLVGPASQIDKTDSHTSRYPDKVVIVFDSEHDWVPLLTLTPSALRAGALLTNKHNARVEQA